mmetsp:Transcript_23081/g.50650  ORF Transcript_23081/g.50650 Transcript_23081/m.50650 type:complete len:232 (+) Transcript_23081:1774-2469(+)
MPNKNAGAAAAPSTGPGVVLLVVGNGDPKPKGAGEAAAAGAGLAAGVFAFSISVATASFAADMAAELFCRKDRSQPPELAGAAGAGDGFSAAGFSTDTDSLGTVAGAAPKEKTGDGASLGVAFKPPSTAAAGAPKAKAVAAGLVAPALAASTSLATASLADAMAWFALLRKDMSQPPLVTGAGLAAALSARPVAPLAVGVAPGAALSDAAVGEAAGVSSSSSSSGRGTAAA